MDPQMMAPQICQGRPLQVVEGAEEGLQAIGTDQLGPLLDPWEGLATLQVSSCKRTAEAVSTLRSEQTPVLT